MLGIFRDLIISARPRHWVKNLALYVPLFFTGHIFDWSAVQVTGVGVVSFCFLSSSNYLLNDLVDRRTDLEHPYKRFRPLAAAQISSQLAFVMALVFGVAGLALAAMLSPLFFWMGVLFLALHYLTTMLLRRLAVVDILAIALGYALRVYAGVVVTGYNISIWLALALISLSLLFAIGKRALEFTLIKIQKGRGKLPQHLVTYSEKLLDTYVAMFATATFITYSYYTFLASPGATGFLVTGLPEGLSRKWMMLTIPFVLYGIMRFLQLLYEESNNTLVKVLTGDRSLVVAVCLWLVTIFVIIYGIGR